MIIIHENTRIFWLTVCICMVLCVFPWIYVAYKFDKHKHEQYFKIRGTILLHSFLILSGIFTCIHTPWVVMHSWASGKIYTKDLTDRILSPIGNSPHHTHYSMLYFVEHIIAATTVGSVFLALGDKIPGSNTASNEVPLMIDAYFLVSYLLVQLFTHSYLRSHECVNNCTCASSE